MSARVSPTPAIVELLLVIERELRRLRLGEAARRLALVIAELQRGCR